MKKYIVKVQFLGEDLESVELEKEYQVEAKDEFIARNIAIFEAMNWNENELDFEYADYAVSECREVE